MTKLLLLLCLLLGMQAVQARKLLEGLNFKSGKWEMYAISLHNYEIHPVQEELGSFMLDDPKMLQAIQYDWDFEEKYEDYCDYHYALKFYRDGELMRTLRVNLRCDYISLGGLSYEFKDEHILEYKYAYKPIKWSRIRFKDMDLLQESIQKLDAIPGVYWYGDVQQYEFDGSFMVGINHLPWNANRDSIAQALTDQLIKETGREDFYIDVGLWYMSDDLEEMSLRLYIYCDKDFGENYPYDNQYTNWRSHFSEQNFIQIMVIGIRKDDYYKILETGHL